MPDVVSILVTKRPHYIPRAIEQIRRQSVPSTLVVVLSNEARGYSFDPRIKPEHTVESKGNVGDARAAGLRFVKSKYPESLLAWFDDDDTYFPRYLETHLEHYEPGKISSGGPHYVKFPTAIFFVPRAPYVQGATMFGATSLFDVPSSVETGEERDMVKGATKRVSLPMIVDRCGDSHTWKQNNVLYYVLCGPGHYATEQDARSMTVSSDPLELGEAMVKYPHAF